MAALALTLGGVLVRRSFHPASRKSQWTFCNTPKDLPQRWLDQGAEMQLLRKFVGALEAVYEELNG